MTETNYEHLWFDKWQVAKATYGIEDNSMTYDKDKYYPALRETFRAYLIDIYRETWRKEYQGLPLCNADPLVIRVVQLHHWPVEVVNGLSEQELMIALADELNHFKIPEKAVRWAYGMLRELPNYEWHSLLEPHRPEDMAELPEY